MADESAAVSVSSIKASVLTATDVSRNERVAGVALGTTSAKNQQPPITPLAANTTAGVAPIASKADKAQSPDWRKQRGKLTEIQPGLLLSDFFGARSDMSSLSRCWRL